MSTASTEVDQQLFSCCFSYDLCRPALKIIGEHLSFPSVSVPPQHLRTGGGRNSQSADGIKKLSFRLNDSLNCLHSFVVLVS